MESLEGVVGVVDGGCSDLQLAEHPCTQGALTRSAVLVRVSRLNVTDRCIDYAIWAIVSSIKIC